MKVRFWPERSAPPDFKGLESRFPPGTRTGEGSESVRMFLEAARKSRVGAAPASHGADSFFADPVRARRQRGLRG